MLNVRSGLDQGIEFLFYTVQRWGSSKYISVLSSRARGLREALVGEKDKTDVGYFLICIRKPLSFNTATKSV